MAIKDGMPYDSMKALEDKMNRNYVAGRIKRQVWIDATRSLHGAYIASNGYGYKCGCFSCSN